VRPVRSSPSPGGGGSVGARQCAGRVASLQLSAATGNGTAASPPPAFGDPPPPGEGEENAELAEASVLLAWIASDLAPALDRSGDSEIAAVLTALDGRFVPPGPSGAPTRGRPDVLPTGRNFYSVDVRAVPTAAAWALGRQSADALALRYFQDEGCWPKSIAMSAWGTSNMRTGGDDIAQVLALIGVQPVWEKGTGRVTGFAVMPLSELGRPRIDVTLRISGMFRDAFPGQIDLIDSAMRAVAALEEPEDANPIAARETKQRLASAGIDQELAMRHAGARIFGAKPGAYGAGLQAMIDEGIWKKRSDLAEAFLAWSSFAYGGGAEGETTRELLTERLASVDAVFHAQDNREHDILDSDDYYQFQGGLAATVETLKGAAPRVYHGDHSRPQRPVVRALSEEIARVVRGRAANPKWIAGIMRHGHKGAFEMVATVDYLFAYAATTNAVQDHHFDQLFDAYIGDERVRAFIAENNAPALEEMAARFREAIERGLWAPRANSAYDRLSAVIAGARQEAAE
jgi:cobaltochelatase CobN